MLMALEVIDIGLLLLSSDLASGAPAGTQMQLSHTV